MLKKIVKKVTGHQGLLDAYRFSIDTVDSEVIYGWAHKIGLGNYSATIEIRSGDETLYTTKANVAREDLKAAAIGTGLYGFSIKTSKIKPQSDITEVDIFIDGIKANANPFPLALVGKEEKPQEQVVEAIDKKSKAVPKVKSNKVSNAKTHRVFVDHANADKVIGWTKKNNVKTHRSFVELKVGDIVIGSDTADTFRQSIKTAGIGDGCYCFEIRPIIHLFPSNVVSCDLYVDGNKSDVAPIELSVTEKALEKAKFSEKFSQELTSFSGEASKELQRLNDEVAAQNGNAVTVALDNIASLSVRVEIIEEILTKHFAK